MELESLATFGITVGIILIAFFFVLNFFASQKANEPVKTGSVKGIIRTSTGKDTGGIKISVARIKSDDKLAYKVIKDNSGRNILTMTNNYGDFEINNIPVGSFWLVIEKKGYRTMLRMVKISENNVTLVDDVTLR